MTQTLLQCGVCGAETRDLYLCAACIDDLAGMIARVPSLVADLNVTLARQDVISRAEKGGKSGKPTPPLPINVSAMEALHELRKASDTVVMLAGAYGRTPERQALLLARNADAGNRSAMLLRAIRLALKVMDRPAALWLFGRCEACAAELWGPPDALRVQCHQCDRGYDGTVLRARQMKAMADMLVTRSQAASLIGGREQMDSPTPVRKAIDKWMERGKLVDYAGRVKLGEVEELWGKRNAMRALKAQRSKEAA